jgi:AhpC/TSA family
VTDEQASVRELGVASPPSGRGAGRSTRLIDLLDPCEDFNFRHFRMRHMLAELLRPGLPPGRQAPDFELASTEGDRLRLGDLGGQAVLLHLVSYTCPVTRGGVHIMRELHRRYGHRVQFLEVLVRQAHPGERHGAYSTWEDKLADARAYRHEEHLPWPVLVDDLAGTVQRAYGGLAAAAYLIDTQGRVAFCGTWGQSAALRAAIDELLDHDGSGAPAGKGSDRRPHLGAAIVAGQGGPLRGGRRALLDLELGFPGAMFLMTVGRVARPLLAPVVLRTTPLPPQARAALLVGVLGAGTAIGLGLQHRRHRGANPRGRLR